MSVLIPALVAVMAIVLILRARHEGDLFLGALALIYAAFMFAARLR